VFFPLLGGFSSQDSLDCLSLPSFSRFPSPNVVPSFCTRVCVTDFSCFFYVGSDFPFGRFIEWSLFSLSFLEKPSNYLWDPPFFFQVPPPPRTHPLRVPFFFSVVDPLLRLFHVDRFFFRSSSRQWIPFFCFATIPAEPPCVPPPLFFHFSRVT